MGCGVSKDCIADQSGKKKLIEQMQQAMSDISAHSPRSAANLLKDLKNHAEAAKSKIQAQEEEIKEETGAINLKASSSEESDVEDAIPLNNEDESENVPPTNQRANQTSDISAKKALLGEVFMSPEGKCTEQQSVNDLLGSAASAPGSSPARLSLAGGALPSSVVKVLPRKTPSPVQAWESPSRSQTFGSELPCQVHTWRAEMSHSPVQVIDTRKTLSPVNPRKSPTPARAWDLRGSPSPVQSPVPVQGWDSSKPQSPLPEMDLEVESVEYARKRASGKSPSPMESWESELTAVVNAMVDHIASQSEQMATERGSKDHDDVSSEVDDLLRSSLSLNIDEFIDNLQAETPPPEEEKLSPDGSDQFLPDLEAWGNAPSSPSSYMKELLEHFDKSTEPLLMPATPRIAAWQSKLLETIDRDIDTILLNDQATPRTERDMVTQIEHQ